MGGLEEVEVVLWLAAPLVYMLPTLVYRITGSSLWRVPIFALWNLLLGWTVIGWFYLLFRAMSPGEREPPAAPAVVMDGPGAGSGPRSEAADEHGSARREIVAVLRATGSARLLHVATGVRVVVTLEGGAAEAGYRLEVPTESLDPRRGQRHRARRAVEEMAWRELDHGADSAATPTSLPDEAAAWHVSVSRGDATAAAAAALGLLATIVDQPLGVPVRVSAGA